MKKALISIDYTYDFVADDGKLTAGKPAQAIEEAITRVTKEAYEAGIISSLLLTVTMRVMIFIQRQNCSHLIISREQVVVIYMVS